MYEYLVSVGTQSLASNLQSVLPALVFADVDRDGTPKKNKEAATEHI